MKTCSHPSALILAACLVVSVWTMAAGQATCPNPPAVTSRLLQVIDCTNPNPIGDPYLWDGGQPGDCATGINRYLARMVQMDGLSDFLFNDGTCVDANGQAIDNCNPPFSLCWAHHCPERYCDQIKYLADINAQFISRGYEAGAYQENHFFEGDPAYCLGRQLITDLNYAYDCAGHRRPVVQAFIGEIGDPNNFHNPAADCDPATPDGINYDCFPGDPVDRHIPAWVIEQYNDHFPGDMDEPDPDALNVGDAYRQYYYQNGAARTDRYFTRDRIIEGGGSSDFEIGKLEMRMWFFYQAVSAIDFGYTAIHMGLYWVYADSERPNYNRLFQLTSAIRDYAHSAGSFVLISGESPMEDVDGGLSATHNGTNQFIFDFDSRAMRPREIAPGISGDGNINENPQGCNQPIPQATLTAIANSPCAGGNFNAVVDPCSIESFGGSIGGISPLGCYIEQMPYSLHWDGGNGIAHSGTNCNDFCFENCNPPIVEAGEASDGPSGMTWGYDDSRWFGQQFNFVNNQPVAEEFMTDECRRWWFDYFYCERRNYHNGNGFIMLPGMLYVRYVERYCTANVPNNAGGLYLMSEDEAFVDQIINQTLAPKLPTIVITEQCDQFTCKPTCMTQTAPHLMRFLVGKRYYKIEVGNKDCSSVYAIHIQGPQGNWFPVAHGTSYVFLPPTPGQYRIIVRQDNLGLKTDGSDGSDGFGSREITKFHPMAPLCRGDGEIYYLELYPNPVSAELNLNFLTPYDETVDLSIMDAVGKTIRRQPTPVVAGENSQVIPTEQLVPGVYTVKVHARYGVLSRRFIKQ